VTGFSARTHRVVFYENYDAVRVAGKAPIRVVDPG
jgi:hypothetical protein